MYRVNLVKDLFTVEIDSFSKIGNFKYGDIEKAYRTGIFETKADLFSLVIQKKNLSVDLKFDKKFYVYYSTGNNEISFLRKVLPFYNPMIRVVMKDRKIVVLYNSAYKNYSFSKFTKTLPIGKVISDLTTWKLLENDFLSFHGGMLFDKSSKSAFILTALPDTGKTFTTLKLLSTGRFNFMSEDIIIISPSGEGFAVPFTRTIDRSNRMSFFKRIKCFFKENLTEDLCGRRTVLDVVREIKITPMAKVGVLYVLIKSNSKGFRKAKYGDILDYIIKFNQIEFSYWRNELILSKIMFSKDLPDIRCFLSKEADLIFNFIKNLNELYIIKGDHENFWKSILESMKA